MLCSTQKHRHGAHLPFLGLEPHVPDAQPDLRLVFQLLGQLTSDQEHNGVANLLTDVTQLHHSQQLNPQPLNRKYNAQPTVPPCHHQM